MQKDSQAFWYVTSLSERLAATRRTCTSILELLWVYYHIFETVLPLAWIIALTSSTYRARLDPLVLPDAPRVGCKN